MQKKFIDLIKYLPQKRQEKNPLYFSLKYFCFEYGKKSEPIKFIIKFYLSLFLFHTYPLERQRYEISKKGHYKKVCKMILIQRFHAEHSLMNSFYFSRVKSISSASSPLSILTTADTSSLIASWTS